jgi:hypothetical protein
VGEFALDVTLLVDVEYLVGEVTLPLASASSSEARFLWKTSTSDCRKYSFMVEFLHVAVDQSRGDVVVDRFLAEVEGGDHSRPSALFGLLVGGAEVSAVGATTTAAVPKTRVRTARDGYVMMRPSGENVGTGCRGRT